MFEENGKSSSAAIREISWSLLNPMARAVFRFTKGPSCLLSHVRAMMGMLCLQHNEGMWERRKVLA